MDANSQLVDAVLTEESPFDFESTFRTHYARIARIITKLVRDPARGEDLASEAFVKLWRHPKAHCENAPGWLYRVAVSFSYEELALSLGLNPASVGTLLGRAQQAFRKEYLERYGQEL